MDSVECCKEANVYEDRPLGLLIHEAKQNGTDEGFWNQTPWLEHQLCISNYKTLGQFS